MEALGNSGLLAGFLDLTTTEVADMLVGGILPGRPRSFWRANPHWFALCRLDWGTRHGQFRAAQFRTCERFQNRKFVIHNPNVTLMRTTRDENRAVGEWIGQRLNLMEGPVRFCCLKAACRCSTGLDGAVP